jgi:uncharacterized RDD family membrane protein YckC
VAARYAKAPSYSELQAAEAHVAVRHAEIATKVALEAQAVAETALAELHAASQEQASRGPAVVQAIAPARIPEPEPVRIPEQVHLQGEPSVERRVQAQSAVTAPAPQPEAVEAQDPPVRQSFGIRWDPDMPVRQSERKPQARRVQEELQLSVEDWWRPGEAAENLRDNPLEAVEPEPAHANLIQFPRELVATRKMRPRMAETTAGPLTEAEAQLSIFEVDPGTVSTEVETPAASQESRTSIWNRSDWSGMRLDAQPAEVPAPVSGANADTGPVPVAPVGLRLMAGVVDCALILASFVTTGFLVAHNFHHPPAGKAAEILGGIGLMVVGLLYYAFFFALPVSTPGMKYAGIALCTFDDQSPTRAQLRRRLGAMVLSLLPVGLGVVWSIFDEDQMSWHDRYSQTYLRKL